MGRIVVGCFIVGLVCLSGAIETVASEETLQLIQQAEALHATRYQEEVMTQIIDLYEAVLPDLADLALQSQSFVLDRLSQLCYEATTFSEGETREDGELFERGKAYGFQSLRLNPAFVEAESRNWDEAVGLATDPAALHWTASNWGKLCGMNPIEGLLQQDKVLALFNRSVALDPGYWGASSMSSLGSLLIMSPPALGGDDEVGLKLIEDSIALRPDYLPNRVVLAEYWGFTYNYFGALNGVRDADLIERETATVLVADDLDAWPFWNRNAQLSAQRLLEQLHGM